MPRKVITLKKDKEITSELIDAIKENNTEDCCFCINNEIVELLKKNSDAYSNCIHSIIKYTWIIARNLTIEVERNNDIWKRICSIKTDEFEYKQNLSSITKEKVLFLLCEK